jgi:hypothetical protein
LTVLLWSGPTNGKITKQATLEITPASGDKYTIIVDWDGLTIQASPAETLAAALGEGNATVSGSIVTLAKSTTIAASSSVTVPKDVTLVVASGKNLTVVSGATLTVAASAKLTVVGDIIVNGTLVSENGSGGTLNGTVTVKSGGILKDKNPSGGSLWSENTAANSPSGPIIFESGAKAYGPDDQTFVLIDTVGCNPAARIFELASGTTLTLKNTEFILDGNATVHGIYSIAVPNGLTIKAGGTLTVNNLWSNEPPADAINFLWVTSSINGEPAGDGKTASKLVSTTYIIYGNGNTNTPKFYTAEGAPAYHATGSSQPDHRSVELGTYNWDATASSEGDAGWKKQ